MTILPPWPDAATLEMMRWWAAGGAAIGFGAVAVQWLAKRVLRKVPAEAQLHIPGAPRVHDPAPTPWGPAGLAALLGCAVIGAASAWGWYGPDEARRPIGVLFAVVGVLQAVRRLLGVSRDAPAVGEPPPDDPEKTVAARLPAAWGAIVFACFGVLTALA